MRDAQLMAREATVPLAYMEGLTYMDIAQRSGFSFKRVDNAMQRVRIETRNALIAVLET